ncbi:NAD dependent epimerase/dehydratase family protein [Anaeromyces robustus]|uniref:NAD dependent epimerase/dehydratase family protein n=1 Tax=Anaeromyces robustus TaxID=1754192 RepID=A0A1Y1XNH4_9FUNG|nr:NAD dependent epimerase/dehydratase family protein [Anaeromyces robustus]|eukprot:ORX87215.1 NAD dependent epimerase/dehydratase family protein [Anaeromyces robustus]
MSKNILIIGATGSIGSKLRKTLLEKTDYKLTLFSTRANRLRINSDREVAISGDVNNKSDLMKVVQNQDAVFAALSGNLGTMAKNIVNVMEQSTTKRLIFISSMGIYNEIPSSVGGGNLNENSMLRPYREAADVIEASNLDYTIIRPGWFDEGSDDYEVTEKGQPFGGHDVSRQAICNLVLKLIQENDYGIRKSLGINRPQ